MPPPLKEPGSLSFNQHEYCYSCGKHTPHTNGSPVDRCLKCNILTTSAVPSASEMRKWLSNYSPEKLRLNFSYAIEQLASSKQLDTRVNDALHQTLLREEGNWFAAYDCYYPPCLTIDAEAKLDAHSPSSLRAAISTFAQQATDRTTALHTFFENLLKRSQTLTEHDGKSAESVKRTIDVFQEMVLAHEVANFFSEWDCHAMVATAIEWHVEDLGMASAEEVQKAIQVMRSQTEYIYPEKRRSLMEDVVDAIVNM
jgi:hypothetical protein